jgi:hypothetical protein
MRTGFSTGSRRPASRGGRSAAARATRRVRLALQVAVGPFAASPQLLARPAARVTAGEVEDFVARHPFWTDGWARFAGTEALADEVRFEREWGRCGPTRPSAASG